MRANHLKELSWLQPEQKDEDRPKELEEQKTSAEKQQQGRERVVARLS